MRAKTNDTTVARGREAETRAAAHLEKCGLRLVDRNFRVRGGEIDLIMRDGRTLIQRIYDDHFEGYEWVERAASILKALPLPDFDRALVDERIGRQLHNAREWRDIINTFFHRLSGIEDVHERKIYR